MSKVKNAIIMAAGISSRFVPLSYEMPKSLFTVKGEVLIERQIRQLLEAGISDITVVVGYMKEKFYYLQEKYGVKIVVNEDYYRYNNPSTLMRVLDQLSGTYICSSDNYFTENVFEAEVEHAYYAAVYSEGETAEWCLATDAEGKITDVTIGGKDAWYMLGHAYFSPEFCEKFREILTKEYENPRTREELWEALYMRYTNELPLYIRRYGPDVIKEFDSLEELREYDETYQNESGSKTMQLIAQKMRCRECEITGIVPIKGGMTNKNFRFCCGGRAYVYRHPGDGTDELIDRCAEKKSTMLAVEEQIDTQVVYFDEVTGVKIAAYIEGAQTMDADLLARPENLKTAAEILHRLHCCEKDTGVPFDIFQMAENYETFIRKNKVELPADYEEIKREVYALKRKTDQKEIKKVPCHNDPLCANWVRGTDRMYLIDWEYAGMNDAMWDVADVAIEAGLTEEKERALLLWYFGREAAAEEWKHFLTYKIFIDYLWTLWGKTRVPFEGDVMEQYAAERYARLKKNMAVCIRG